MRMESIRLQSSVQPFGTSLTMVLFLSTAAVASIALACFLIYRIWVHRYPPSSTPIQAVDLTQNRLGPIPLFHIPSDTSFQSRIDSLVQYSNRAWNHPEVSINAEGLSDLELQEWLQELAHQELNLWGITLNNFSGDEGKIYKALAPFKNLNTLTFAKCPSLTQKKLGEFLSKLGWKRLSLIDSVQFSDSWCETLAKSYIVVSPSGKSNEEEMKTSLVQEIYAITQGEQLVALEKRPFFSALATQFCLNWDLREPSSTDCKLVEQLFAWLRNHKANLIGFQWTNAPEDATFLCHGRGLPIQKLSLCKTRIAVEQLKALHFYPNLTVLNLSNSGATSAEGNVWLMKLKLRELVLDGYAISGEMVQTIAQNLFASLEFLSLRDLTIDPSIIDGLVQMGGRNLLKPFVITWSPQARRYQIDLGTLRGKINEQVLRYITGPLHQLRFGVNSDIDSSFFIADVFNDPEIKLQKIDFQNNLIYADLLSIFRKWPLEEISFTGSQIRLKQLEIGGEYNLLKATAIEITGFDRTFFNLLDGFSQFQELSLSDQDQALESRDIGTLIEYKQKGIKKLTLLKLDIGKKVKENKLTELISGLERFTIDTTSSKERISLVQKLCKKKQVACAIIGAVREKK